MGDLEMTVELDLAVVSDVLEDPSPEFPRTYAQRELGSFASVDAQTADRIIESLEEGKFRGVASELTLLELTVRPLRIGRQDAADDYEVLLDYFPNFELIPISREILLEAASLRARQNLRTPDAIQIATGLRAGATLAVTNDKAWRSVPLIETLLLPDSR